VRLSEAIVIGSDQVAEMDGLAIGSRAGTRTPCSNCGEQGRPSYSHGPGMCADPTAAARRIAWTPGCGSPAAAGALERYCDWSNPRLHWLGQIESLGICLVESVRSDDPTALIGLPLISLTSMLAGFGVALPAR